MHEIGLVDDIISKIRSELISLNGSGVKAVNICIGELEHVTPEHFEFHFRERARGTKAEKSELKFKKVKARFRCKNCNREFSISEGSIGCPDCGSKTSDIISGSGVYVESIEIY
jgi:hydrogenase nickel incorporation protein HypA/HybF